MPLLFADAVELDLEDIVEQMSLDSVDRAIRFLDDIRDELRLISAGPRRYQVRPEIGPDARLSVVGRYVILFRILGADVRVDRVLYGGRDLVGMLR